MSNEEYNSKLADHAFEVVKFLISLSTFIGGLYVTVLGGYFAFESSEFGRNSGFDAIYYFMVVVSTATIVVVWVLHWLVGKAIRSYEKYLALLDPATPLSSVNRLLVIGFFLAIAATCAVLLAIWTVYQLQF